jgi:hypothetical protein
MKSFYQKNRKCQRLRKYDASSYPESQVQVDTNSSSYPESQVQVDANSYPESQVIDAFDYNKNGVQVDDSFYPESQVIDAFDQPTYNGVQVDDSSDPEWKDENIDSHENDLVEGLIKSKFVDELLASSLRKHLSSTVGGNKTIKSINTLISRVSSILSWLQSIWPEKTTTKEIISELLRVHYEVIGDYIAHLRDVMSMQASTALAYLEDFLSFLKWYVLYNGQRHQSNGLVMSDMLGIQDVIKNVRRKCRQERKREKGMSKDIPTLTKMSLWPEGGMRQLIYAVESEVDWISKIESRIEDRSTYSKFIKVMCAAIYLSPQGRVQAVEDTRNNQVEELKNKRFILSKVFKTASKYGYQPVTAGEIFLKIFDIYLRFVRPRLLMGPIDFVFIELDGSKIDMGRKLIAFFETKIGLHITSTTIRSLVETEVHELRQDQKISAKERDSIMNLNGHSSQVVKDYYIRHDREKDVGHAFNVFDLMNNDLSPSPLPPQQSTLSSFGALSEKRKRVFAISDSESDADIFISPLPRNIESVILSSDSLNQDPDDCAHQLVSPASTSTPVRVKWTEQEINYVGRWCAKTLKDNPANRTNIVARCLAHIRSEPSVMSIFHKNHILNSSRLRHAYEAYQNLNTRDN